MKTSKTLLGVLAAILVPAAIFAASVTASEYIKQYSLYNRSDGLFQRTDSHGLDVFINGYRGASLGKAIYEDFTEYQDGDMTCMETDWTACSGTNTQINLLTFPSGNQVAHSVIGAQTAGMDMDAGSLDISGDQTNDEGGELVWFMHGASGKPFVIGEDPAFYQCAKFAFADATASTDDFHVGFRSVEPFQAAFDDYQEVASIGIITTNVTIETLTGSSTTTTDTTENAVDATTYTYCIYVSAAGVVTYTIDGHAPATTAAYTFVDSTEVVPFIYILQNVGTATGEVDLYEWEIGYQ